MRTWMSTWMWTWTWQQLNNHDNPIATLLLWMWLGWRWGQGGGGGGGGWGWEQGWRDNNNNVSIMTTWSLWCCCWYGKDEDEGEKADMNEDLDLDDTATTTTQWLQQCNYHDVDIDAVRTKMIWGGELEGQYHQKDLPASGSVETKSSKSNCSDMLNINWRQCRNCLKLWNVNMVGRVEVDWGQAYYRGFYSCVLN